MFSPPGEGRTFTACRIVRLGDVLPSGGARLDGVARWLQDVAADDLRDAGVEGEVAWVVRRTAVAVTRRPRYGRPVELTTWCSGTGMSWAERRTTVTDDAGVAAEGVALWVALDPKQLRPVVVEERFSSMWGEQARSRRVRSRLIHPRPPAAGTTDRALALRLADLDLIGHVNNAIAFAVVEEEITRLIPDAIVSFAEVEYRVPIEMGASVTVRTAVGDGGLRCWLVDGAGAPLASAQVRIERFLPPSLPAGN